jgi:hypothetical protein
VGNHVYLKEKEVVATTKSDQKIILYFLAAGFLIPCLLYLIIVAGDARIQGSWILVPWQTVAPIMSAEAGGGTTGQVIAFLISAAANAAVYGLIGVAFRFVYRRFHLLDQPELASVPSEW